MEKEKFDVFIAYHGTYENGGSRESAAELEKYLLDKGLKVFFYPTCNKDAYKTNIFEVINSKTLLLMVSNGIHRDSDGKINHGSHYELCLELDSFYSSSFLDGNDYKPALNSKVVFCGEYDENFLKGDEAKLHDLFKNRTHFEMNKDDVRKTYEEIYDWIVGRTSSSNENKYISSRLSNEVEKVYSKRPAMISGEKINEKILTAKKIVCIGISNSDLTTKIDEDAIYEFLDNGGSIEMYFLNPEGKYTKEREIEEGFDDSRIKLTTINNIRVASQFRQSLPDNLKQNYKMFTYDVSPRLNIIFIDSCLYLQFYGFISRGIDTPAFSVKKCDNRSPLFDYCCKSYEYIKACSKEIDYE